MNTRDKNRENPDSQRTIVLMGRPNVGKSTLFNRLTRSRKALVTSVPGTTRDRKEAEVVRDGLTFKLVDTGGLGFGQKMAFSREVETQIETALKEADLVWMIMDAMDGLNPFDEELHRRVVHSGKPFLAVVNKADNPELRGGLSEFFRLGVEDVFPISSLHGTGIGEVLERSSRILPAICAEQQGAAEEGEGPQPTRVALVGRPNVGKSSLLNRILGDERMIVSPIPGTTRESVEVPFRAFGKEYLLVDTAGIRRRSRTKEHLEKIGVLQSLGAIPRVQVALLVVDAGEEIATQDARIASYILERNRAVVLLLNKWDCIGKSRKKARAVEDDIERKLGFLNFAARVRTSALVEGPQGGQGLEKVFREIDNAASQFSRKIQTADLNRMIQAAVLRFPPPMKGRSHTRVNYGLQVGTGPPTFRFFTNHPESITDSYTRFFENQLRYHFGFAGTPLRIHWQGKDSSRRGG